MVLILQTANISNAGVGYDLGAVDSVYVDRNVIVNSTGDAGIVNSGSNQIMTIAGTVRGISTGIRIGNGISDAGNQLWVLAGASVSGGYGVRLDGTGTSINNAGSIAGSSSGIYFSSAGTAKTTLVSSGHIIGEDALYFSGLGTAAVDIINTGEMVAAGGKALNGNSCSGAIRLVNKGYILGSVEFGEANDFYDSRGGTVQGNIVGRNGNDTFIPGDGAENIDGDGGIVNGTADALDFRSFASIKVSLDESIVHTGNAFGDVYTNIEVVFGTTGVDTIVGDGGANVLLGLGGIDTINGKAGADTLVGGGAKDILTGGGAGNDRFRFDALAECGDSILDFSSAVAGNNDHIAIKASVFGGGLVAGATVVGGAQPGAQFITRADNVAQDPNDRFIFRTTDKTLWFDVNGNGAGGLTMVADLQAAATFTNLDIILI